MVFSAFDITPFSHSLLVQILLQEIVSSFDTLTNSLSPSTSPHLNWNKKGIFLSTAKVLILNSVPQTSPLLHFQTAPFLLLQKFAVSIH